MAHNCKRLPKSGGCCREDKATMRCATTALKQIKDMFGTTAYQQQINRKPDKCKGENAGCVLDSVCEIRECPFRGTGVAPNVLQTYCTDMRKTGSGQSDRNAMRLMPGDVGLRDNRATFSLARDDGLAHGGYSIGGGTVYYNMQPKMVPIDQEDESDDDEYEEEENNNNEYNDDEDYTDQQSRLQDQDQDQEEEKESEQELDLKLDQELDSEQDQKLDSEVDQELDSDEESQMDESEDQLVHSDRKHVMEVLPVSKKPTLGPVTGLPVSDDEHVFVLWLGKRPGEPDERARLQIEVRVPKLEPDSEEEESVTSLVNELPVVPVKSVKPKKGRNSKKSGKHSKK